MKNETSKKITKATFKAFIRKNRQALLVKVKSSFCGMSDMVEQVEDDFDPAENETHFGEAHSCGISGVYLVGGSRDYFTAYETETHLGIEFYNCCGSGIVAIAKEAAPVAPEPVKEAVKTPAAPKVKLSTKSECKAAVDSFYWLASYITGGTREESLRQAPQGIKDLEAKAAKVADLIARGGKLVREDSHLQERAAAIPARIATYRERYLSPEPVKEAAPEPSQVQMEAAASQAIQTLLDSGLTVPQLQSMTEEQILKELQAVTRRNAFSIVA